jgi:CheY-like chemotaxis protein
MDLGMPGMDGLETAKLLKRERVTNGIPIVAVTGQTVMSDERFRAKGFAELISKPCDPLQLAAALRRILGR